MKKVRTTLIIILIAGLVLGGISYAARKAASRTSDRVVEVTAVGNVNEQNFYSDYSNMEGIIISKDTQSVFRNKSYALKKVYVKEGDQVKKGDKLLEYDMEKLELEEEKAELDKWGLELELESLEKQLELLKQGIVPNDESYSYTGTTRRSSDDEEDDEDDEEYDDYEYDDEDYDEDYDDADYDDEDYVDLSMSADAAPEESFVRTREEYDIIEDDDEDEEFIIEEDNDPYDGSGGSSGSGVNPDSGIDTGEDDEIALLTDINAFLSSANLITEAANASLSDLGNDTYSAMIDEALTLFRTRFAESMESTQTNLLGEKVTVKDYSVTEWIASVAGETTAHVLQTAYDRLCVYEFVSVMEKLNPGKDASSKQTAEDVLAQEDLVQKAVNCLVSLPGSVFNDQSDKFATAYDALNNKWTKDGSQNRVEYLKAICDLLNGNTLLVPGDESTDTIMTEGMSQSDLGEPSYDGDDFDDGEDVDFAEMIKETEAAIFEQKLQIREAELNIKDYKEKLDGKIVKAILDGVVLTESAGSTSGSSKPIIVVTGKKGLYVRGYIQENSLDTVKVGDTIYGSSYEGMTFTAEVVEISEFPETGNNDAYYFGMGDSNSNESNYPFLAFIEDTDGLEVDDGVALSLQGPISEYGESTGGLTLNACLIRTDDNGRSYSLVEGRDGRLEKRYLELGTSEWGFVKIKSGLSREDFIAFPYGQGVTEGAKTTRVDSLKAMEYGYSDYY